MTHVVFQLCEQYGLHLQEASAPLGTAKAIRKVLADAGYRDVKVGTCGDIQPRMLRPDCTIMFTPHKEQRSCSWQRWLQDVEGGEGLQRPLNMFCLHHSWQKQGLSGCEEEIWAQFASAEEGARTCQALSCLHCNAVACYKLVQKVDGIQGQHDVFLPALARSLLANVGCQMSGWGVEYSSSAAQRAALYICAVGLWLQTRTCTVQSSLCQ